LNELWKFSSNQNSDLGMEDSYFSHRERIRVKPYLTEPLYPAQWILKHLFYSFSLMPKPIESRSKTLITYCERLSLDPKFPKYWNTLTADLSSKGSLRQGSSEHGNYIFWWKTMTNYYEQYPFCKQVSVWRSSQTSSILILLAIPNADMWTLGLVFLT
jgi:hypothetical protein